MSPKLVPRSQVQVFEPINRNRPHQGEAEKARRRRQMERAARKQELKK